MKNKFFKTLLSTFMLLGSVAAIAACDNGPQMTDYAHNGSVKLSLDYAEKDFFKDGIAEVTVETYIDGDTTHFKNVYGDTSTLIKSRYYGIDTPESTGAIQPFGKKASAFTKSKLANAAKNGTIVVSSPFSTSEEGSAGRYGKPEPDSTGGRYLSLVWINENVRHAPVDSLVLLNLWIVQEGLSWAKNTSEVPAYAPTFTDAQNQAEKLVLNLWTEFDPDYNYGDYETVSLLDIKNETKKYLEDPSYVNAFTGKNVRFTAVVGGYSNHNLYLQQYYPADDDDSPKAENPRGEWAGINFFCGMGAIPDEFTKEGALLEVVGKATNSDTFGFQISDGKFLATESVLGDEDVAKVLLTPEENDGEYELLPFEYTREELNQRVKTKNYEALFCRTIINENLYCNDVYVSKGGDITLYFQDCDFNAYIPFVYHGDPTNSGDVWGTADKFLGKTFKLSGIYAYNVYKKNDGSYDIKHQIVLCGDSDLVCITPKEGTTVGNPYTVYEAVNNVASILPNVTYYVKGEVGEVHDQDSVTATSSLTKLTVTEAYDRIKLMDAGAETQEKYFIEGTVKSIDHEYDKEKKNISFTITDGKNSLSVYNTKLADNIPEDVIKVGCFVQLEGALKKYVKDALTTPEITGGLVKGYKNSTVVSFTMVSREGLSVEVDKAGVPSSVTATATDEADKAQKINAYLARVVAGSYVIIKGTPVVNNGEITYKNVTFEAAYEHGQTKDSPLTTQEAMDVCAKLQDNTYSTGNYYIAGNVTQIVNIDKSKPTQVKLTFKIVNNEVEYLITGAKFAVNNPNLTYEDVNVGCHVIVYVKLMKLVEGNQITYTTRDGSSQIVDLNLLAA